MAFFKKDYNKPGPGVPKNAPKKKGVARFAEIVGRDISSLVKLNIIYQICILPAQLLLLFALLSLGVGYGSMFVLFGLLALLFSFPVGPATVALNLLVSKMLRDEPGFVWHDFKKAFKENFKSSVAPGMIYSLILGAQAFAYFYYISLSATTVGFLMAALYFFSVLLFALASPYFFLQSAYLDLKTGGLLRNSVALALGFLPRSLVGALLGTGLVLGQMLLFPFLTIVTFFVGYTIPLLMNLMWIWPPVDKTFSIDETLRKRTEERVDAQMEESGATAIEFEKSPALPKARQEEKEEERDSEEE